MAEVAELIYLAAMISINRIEKLIARCDALCKKFPIIRIQQPSAFVL
jgi:hypothetical protein